MQSISCSPAAVLTRVTSGRDRSCLLLGRVVSKGNTLGDVLAEAVDSGLEEALLLLS